MATPIRHNTAETARLPQEGRGSDACAHGDAGAALSDIVPTGLGRLVMKLEGQHYALERAQQR